MKGLNLLQFVEKHKQNRSKLFLLEIIDLNNFTNFLGLLWPDIKVQVSTEGAKCIRINRNLLTEEKITDIINQNRF